MGEEALTSECTRPARPNAEDCAYKYACRNCIHGGKAAGCKECFECCKQIKDHYVPLSNQETRAKVL